jgi:hypothetical protein
LKIIFTKQFDKNKLLTLINIKMKNNILKSLMIVSLMVISIMIFGQPTPGDGVLNGGEGSGPVGGGAPIGGGLIIFFSLTVGYVIRRIFEIRKKAVME